MIDAARSAAPSRVAKRVRTAPEPPLDTSGTLAAEVDRFARERAWHVKLSGTLSEITSSCAGLREREVSIADVDLIDRSALRLRNPDARVLVAKPDTCVPVGSFFVNCAYDGNPNVDVAVQMPRSMFLQKDFLNYKYLDKRCLFLGALAQHLRNELAAFSVRLIAFREDPDKPILEIKLLQQGSYAFRLIPCVALDTFPPAKLSPSRNCVRSGVLKDEGFTPTPWYNSCILEDMMLTSVNLLVSSTLATCPTLKRASIVFRAWIHQQGLEGHDTYHAFRIFLSAIASHESFYFELPGTDRSRVTASQLEFKDRFAFLLVEPSGVLNLAARVSQAAAEHMREEARRTLSALSSHLKPAVSRNVFLSSMPALLAFDAFTSFSIPEQAVESSGGKWEGRQYADSVTDILKCALGTRAVLIRTFIQMQSGARTLLVAVRLNEQNMNRLVDVGPASENTAEAAAFRSFWGPKAELRRFKDGTICESVVWEHLASKREEVVGEIVKYALHRHLNVNPDAISTVGSPTLLPVLTIAGHYETGIGASKALDALSKQMRSLNGLPLQIASIMPCHPVFSYTEPLPPAPSSLAGSSCPRNPSESICVRALDVVLQFESSARWPDNIEAISHTKSAFYLQMHHALYDEAGVASIPTAEHLDVFFAGYVFRFKIYHDREVLLARTHDEKLAASLDRNLVQAPLHRASIHALVNKYPSYGLAVRIAKRWSRVHMFYPCLSDDAIELIVASCWPPSSALLPVPSSAFSGFLRFLHVLASHDWRNEVMSVDVEDTVPTEMRKESKRKFDAMHSSLRPAMVVVSSLQQHANMTSSLTQNVVDRLKLYADRTLKSALDMLKGSMDASDWMMLFRTPSGNGKHSKEEKR
eukprot:tig00020544_g10486.t1